MPPGYPPPQGGPPQWGGPPQGGPPQLPPKASFPWAIVVVIGFLVAVAIGGYIYKKAANDPFKRWEEGVQENTQRKIDDSIDRELEAEMERLENDPEHRAKRLEQWKELENADDTDVE